VLGELTCAENIVAALTFGRTRLWGRAAQARAEELLARVGLAGKASLHAEQLTYIDQKRLELARALALAPDLLLLDEWLAGLNPAELQEGIALVRSLRSEGITILKDLTGKKLGVPSIGGSLYEILLKVRLQEAGLDPEKDVSWHPVPYPQAASALMGKAVAVLAPWEAFTAEAE